MSAQHITYNNNKAGQIDITLLGPGDSRFEQEISDISANPKSVLDLLGELKPYLTLVQNKSSKNILHFTVRYELQFHDGSLVVWTHMLRTTNGDGASSFTPGQSLLAFPGVVTVGHGMAQMRRELLADQLRQLQSAKQVGIEIDSVILESGLIVGPDKSGSAVRYKAEKQAIVDMINELERRAANPSESAQYLQNLANSKQQASTYAMEKQNFDVKFQYDKTQRSVSGWLLFRYPNPLDALNQLQVFSRNMKDLQIAE